MNLTLARENMIEQQVRPWDVLDQRVLDTLASLPRERFVSVEHHGIAYSDYALPIGHGQTMLKPALDGRLLQALDISPTDRVLEIGTGSGYLAACLSRLGGSIDSVEIIGELATSAQDRLATLGISNVNCRHLDAADEWDAADDYDGIVFTGSIRQIPDFYLQKMAINGRLCAIVGHESEPTMEAILMTRVSATEWVTDSQFETTAPPLANFGEEMPAQSFQF